MTSVVIAAHNEAAVIGRCLDSILDGAEPGEFDITVVANGCSDDTAGIARRRAGVRVIELVQPGKPGALNAGDTAAVGFPRIYLDADVVMGADGLRRLAARLATPAADGTPTPLAAVPRRKLDLARAPIMVRAFFAINARLPVYRHGLFGRGVIALSAEGRDRFSAFPDMVADDLFLDSLFAPDEKCQVEAVTARVAVPADTRDLLRRLTRVRAGNSAMRAAGGQAGIPAQVRRAARMSWLRDVVLPRPWLAPAAVCYVAVTVAAGYLARRHGARTDRWARDESSRRLGGT